MEKHIHKEDEISLKELILKLQESWQYLMKKWLIILIVGFIGAFIGFAYSASKRPFFVAELSFILEDGQSSGAGGIGAYSGLASIVGVDIGNNSGIFIGDNLIEFMRSRSMIQKTLLSSIERSGKKQTLAEFYIDIYNIRAGWENDPKLKKMHFLNGEDSLQSTREKDSVLVSFYKNIISSNLTVAKKNTKLSIITATVRSENELFSKLFAETLVKVVSDFYIQTKTKKSSENIAVLKHQVDSVRRALGSAITGVATSTDVNPNANPSRQILKIPSQSRQIDVQTNTAILQQLLPSMEAAKVALRKETPLIQIIDSPILPLEKVQYSKKKGLIYGGLSGGIVAILILLFVRIWKHIIV